MSNDDRHGSGIEFLGGEVVLQAVRDYGAMERAGVIKRMKVTGKCTDRLTVAGACDLIRFLTEELAAWLDLFCIELDADIIIDALMDGRACTHGVLMKKVCKGKQ